MEVFRDPSKRATLICDSSFSELSQYKFLESQSKARLRQFTISARQGEKRVGGGEEMEKVDGRIWILVRSLAVARLLTSAATCKQGLEHMIVR